MRTGSSYSRNEKVKCLCNTKAPKEHLQFAMLNFVTTSKIGQGHMFFYI